MTLHAVKLARLIPVAIACLALSSRPALAVIGWFGWGLVLGLAAWRSRFLAAGTYRSRTHGVIHLLGLVLVGNGIGALLIGGAGAPLFAHQLRAPTAASLAASTIFSLTIIAAGMLIRRHAIRLKPGTAAA